MKEKIGILGGAFNPPHFGHLKIAKIAKKKFNLKKIYFIPCGIPPLKKKVADPKTRLKMLKMLLSPYKDFEIIDWEIKRAKENKKSYTIDTIAYLKKKFKNKEIYWIIGEDSFREIIEGKWKGGLKILDLVKFIVFKREGHPYSLKNLPKKYQKRLEKTKKKVIFVETKIPISSTEIRKKIKKNKNLDNLLPKKIQKFIQKNKIYG